MQMEDSHYRTLHKYTKALSVALGFRDELTRMHSERVLGLSQLIGESLSLTENEIGVLKIAASFHDIGKIGVPDNILLKPASFDDAEWVIMRQHPVIGEQILVSTELQGAQQAAKTSPSASASSPSPTPTTQWP